jgi:hypothetical protein
MGAFFFSVFWKARESVTNFSFGLQEELEMLTGAQQKSGEAVTSESVIRDKLFIV